nr:MAG TPA: hypothetical protein [Microviridae sp.]
MERSDFLIGAFRSGILARRRAKAGFSDLPCLYTSVYIYFCPGSITNRSRIC